MPIDVYYFANFKDITGIDKEKIELSEYTLKELVNLLFEKYFLIKNLMWDQKENKLKKTISVAINDKLIRHKNKLSISLYEGDKVAFLLPISGG